MRWLGDRFARRVVLVAGCALLAAGCMPAGGTDNSPMELPDGEVDLCDASVPDRCAPGSTQSCGCGDVGTQTCGANCGWGACAGADAGVCDPGASQSCTDACGNSGMQACNSSCAWNDCDSAAPEQCQPNDFQSCTDGCGNAGAQACAQDCTWGGCVAPSSGGTCATCDPTSGTACATGKVCGLNDVCGSAQYTASDGTVADTFTGLTWQQSVPASPCPSDMPGVCTWADAMAYCQNLSLDGTGWRLPALNELFSLVAAGSSPSIDGSTFPGTPPDYFWAAAADASTSGYSWVVGFDQGEVLDQSTKFQFYVRCVRTP